MYTKHQDANTLTLSLKTKFQEVSSYNNYNSLSDEELQELWEDMIADDIINQQKSFIINYKWDAEAFILWKRCN